MVSVIAYAYQTLNNVRVISNGQLKNISVGHFKFLTPIKKPFIFLIDAFQISLGYWMNVSWETVSRNCILDTVG
jgi:hypothetical protein